MGVRIFSLAKELEMTTRELVAFLRTQGHSVNSHLSMIEDHVAGIIRDRLQKSLGIKPKAKETAAATATKSGGDAAASDSSTDRRTEKPVREWGPDAAARGQRRPEDEGSRRDKQQPQKRKRYFPTRDDLFDSGRFGGARRKFGQRGRKKGQRDPNGTATVRPDKVEIGLPITLKQLSAELGIKANVLTKSLLQAGHMVTVNQYLDEEQILLLSVEHEVEINFRKKDDDLEERLEKLEKAESSEEELVPRAPIVTFLGHVDHGKTSLLDRIRKSKVTSTEAGGITQHIGAYRVDYEDVHVTFIDTPGHKAFTEMRARGAGATDVAVLVVAVDDGVMPQTEEAINHARAAGVPIVVALNKIDRPNGNPDRCKQQLSELGLLPAEWNGDTEFVPVSAQTGEGIDTLLETLSLTSEILELKANPNRPAVGVVLEAENTTGRGVVATVLVKDGTLKKGDTVLAGPAHGRVRSLLINGGDVIDSAGPATPVEITGLSEVPEAGDTLLGVSNPQDARELADARQRLKREKERAGRQSVSLETIFEDQGVEELRLILKGDAKGSVAALQQALEQLSTDEVQVRILHSGVGAVSLDDIQLADASGAVVIGFHVTADERARQLADERDVEIRVYDIIYKAIEEIRDAMAAQLEPDREEKVQGHAEIRQIYKASKIGTIAGCFVTDGLIRRTDQVRLLRDGRIVYKGQLSSLKRFKDDAKEVREGFECGLKIAGYDDIKEGDVVEAFNIVETPRTL